MMIGTQAEMHTSKSKLVKKAVAASKVDEKKAAGDKKPKLEEFIKTRDYTGACILLEFQKQTGEGNKETLPWLGYSAFHLGEYKKALDVYTDLLKEKEPDPNYHLFAACCQFNLGLYKEAEEQALKGPAVPLQNRILFHVAHKLVQLTHATPNRGLSQR